MWRVPDPVANLIHFINLYLQHIWGMYLNADYCVHGSERQDYSHPFAHDKGTVYGVLLDLEQRTLSFIDQDRNCGIAYRNLPTGCRFFPAIGLGCLWTNKYVANFNATCRAVKIKRQTPTWSELVASEPEMDSS